MTTSAEQDIDIHAEEVEELKRRILNLQITLRTALAHMEIDAAFVGREGYPSYAATLRKAAETYRQQLDG
jgi:hypothetical protein